MPGSIQVSVLDFKELPSSPNSVKVSLGKVEYEAGDKGDFSFPLTNLRDNLIISIQDYEGNPVSHSGVRITSIIEKGTWDDLFPIEGGGFVHMKLQFILSEEERNRIRLMRASAMKKKQDEILSSRLRNAESANTLSFASSLRRHEVSDVLMATSSQDFQGSSFSNDGVQASFLAFRDDTAGKAAASSVGIKQESFQSQTSPNATDRREETSSSPMIEGIHQKPLVEDIKTQAPLTDLVKNKSPDSKTSNYPPQELDKQNLEEKIPSDVKGMSKVSTSTPLLHETKVSSTKSRLQRADASKRLHEEVCQKALVEDPETRATTDSMNENKAAKSTPLYNLAGKLDMQNLVKKVPSYVKTTSKESTPPSPSQKTKVDTIRNNEIEFQHADIPERLQEAASGEVGSSRSTIAEKIKSFSPKLAREPDKHGQPEKAPHNIRKMISVFESGISQDRAAFKPPSKKSYGVGTLRLLKDHAAKDYSEKSESSFDRLKNLEMSSSTRLRNSFSTDDLQKNLSGIVRTGEQIGFDNDFVEPNETNVQSKGMVASVGVDNEEKFVLKEINTKDLPRSEDATVLGRTHEDNKETDDGDRTMSLLDVCGVEGKSHQEKTFSSMPESIAKASGELHCGSDVTSRTSSPKSSDEQASTGSLGQAIKIALVVGFGVLVLLCRKREPGKVKKKENNPAYKTRVFMNKQGSIEEQLRKIDVLKLS